MISIITQVWVACYTSANPSNRMWKISACHFTKRILQFKNVDIEKDMRQGRIQNHKNK